ncbi:MAG: GT4 family glycosyltransferase PelF [Nitratireductor sp.]|nr:GT4 family glycosyltransferase PelF [Nitratireductor sp.]
MSIPAFSKPTGQPADVCLIVEGCYPHISGGVSTWLDWLMRACPTSNFAVRSIVTPGEARSAKYAFPDNLVDFSEIVLAGPESRGRRGIGTPAMAAHELAALAVAFLESGRLGALARLEQAVNDPNAGISLRDLVSGPYAWRLCLAAYQALMPHAPFKDFFWAWHALMGGLFSTMKAELPPARTYHAISTGYAGLLAARAALHGAGQVALTEHGIYTNERRIEILMADWIVDTVDKGLAMADRRRDLRDLWITAFESYARACYEACDHVTTLFAGNQPMQRLQGARESQLSIIANGIDLDRFGAVPTCPPGNPPTVSLIGRVVPIKDIKTFVSAAGIIRDRVPNARVIVAGSMDEDPDYAAECLALVEELGLSQTVEFAGKVDTATLLATTDVVVLTSLSEAQPLTILEAGAAGRPCVTTDVGACRDIIEGEAGREGGFIAELLAADQIAEHVVRLLLDEQLRTKLGENLRSRVWRDYASETSAEKYRALYASPDGTLQRAV